MALSGSTNFNITVGDAIDSALRKLHAIGPNETATAGEINNAKEAVDMLLKEWSAAGLRLWLRKSQSITLVTDDADYTLGPSGADVTMDRPLDIISAYRRDSNNLDVPLIQLSREDYRMLSNKTSTGSPIQFYYDKQLTTSTLYVWPVPGATEASEYTLHINYRKPMDDADATTDDLELPQEFYRAFVWNLANELVTEYAVPERLARRIERMANASKEIAFGLDIDDENSVYLHPVYEGMR